MELIVRVENDPSLIGIFEGTVEGSMLDDWYHRRFNEIENTYYTIATVGWDDVRDKEPGEFGLSGASALFALGLPVVFLYKDLLRSGAVPGRDQDDGPCLTCAHQGSEHPEVRGYECPED